MAMAHSAQDLASRRGSVAAARIQALPLQQLESVAEALLDFTGPADLASWLAAHAG